MNQVAAEKEIFKRITSLVGKAIARFDLIREGDRILVALSGGKDSWTLLNALEYLRRRAPVRFELVAVHIEQGYDPACPAKIESALIEQQFEFYIEQFDIASLVREKNKGNDIPCSLCARLRRGALYGYADKYYCNKIALGHHADDFIETLLLNSFFIGKIAAMAPKLTSPDKKPVIIRPLLYVAEKDIIDYVKAKQIKTVTCSCLVGRPEPRRQRIKRLINELESEIPFLRQSLLKSLAHVRPSHLLDHNLSDWS